MLELGLLMQLAVCAPRVVGHGGQAAYYTALGQWRYSDTQCSCGAAMCM